MMLHAPCSECNYLATSEWPMTLTLHYQQVHNYGHSAALRRAGLQWQPCPGCGVRGGFLHQPDCSSPGWSPERGTEQPDERLVERVAVRHIALPCMRCGLLMPGAPERQQYHEDCQREVNAEAERRLARRLRVAPKTPGCYACQQSKLGACGPCGGLSRGQKRGVYGESAAFRAAREALLADAQARPKRQGCRFCRSSTKGPCANHGGLSESERKMIDRAEARLRARQKMTAVEANA